MDYYRMGGPRYCNECKRLLELTDDETCQPCIIKSLKASLADAQERVGELTELAKAGMELAEYASYAEIVGAISNNRSVIRKWCDKVFELNNTVMDLPILGAHNRMRNAVLEEAENILRNTMHHLRTANKPVEIRELVMAIRAAKKE